MTFKSPWAARRIPQGHSFEWRSPDHPRAGDILLCEVTRLGIHGRLETGTGRRAKLYKGDRIVSILGNRYATALLEGVAELRGSSADLLSASGLCGRIVERSDKTSAPTTLHVVGQAFENDAPLNLSSFRLAPAQVSSNQPVWFLVVGTDMDSGKTTACASLIHGLAKAGRRVGAAKLTGTASGRDVGSYSDAGATPVFDFLDFGLASTARCSSEEITRVATGLMDHLSAADVEVGVLEVADGLLQPETQSLVTELANRGPSRVVVTARESIAALGAIERLEKMGHTVAAVSGLVTASPLSRREVERASSIECVRTGELGLRVEDWMKGAHAASR